MGKMIWLMWDFISDHFEHHLVRPMWFKTEVPGNEYFFPFSSFSKCCNSVSFYFYNTFLNWNLVSFFQWSCFCEMLLVIIFLYFSPPAYATSIDRSLTFSYQRSIFLQMSEEVLRKSEVVHLKCKLLRDKCDEIEEESNRKTEQLYQINKNITRLQKRKLKLVKLLQDYGDDFRSSKTKFIVDDKHEAYFEKVSPVVVTKRSNCNNNDEKVTADAVATPANKC